MEDYAVVAMITTSSGGLVVVRDPFSERSRWKFPGGRKEGVENPWQTAVREVEEETGISINPRDLHLLNCEDRENHKFYLFQSFTKTLTGLKKQGDEGEEIKIIPVKHIANMSGFLRSHQEAFKRFFVKPR